MFSLAEELCAVSLEEVPVAEHDDELEIVSVLISLAVTGFDSVIGCGAVVCWVGEGIIVCSIEVADAAVLDLSRLLVALPVKFEADDAVNGSACDIVPPSCVDVVPGVVDV